MNWKNRLTNYNFWISIFSAVLLILQALKIEFDIAYVNEIFTAVLGLLVVIGIISDPTRTTVKSSESAHLTTFQTKQESVEIEKIEDNLEDKVEKQEVTNQNVLPIEEEDEVDNVNSENDLQTILTKISTNLDEKISELVHMNIETLNKLNQKQSSAAENTKHLFELDQNEENSPIMENSPAAAEMSNPFIDVIN